MEIAKLINEADKADNFIIGTGELTKVEDFVKKSFSKLNLDYKDFVKTSDALKRPLPTGTLKADTSKLENTFKTKPKVLIDELISLMIESDLKQLTDN